MMRTVLTLCLLTLASCVADLQLEEPELSEVCLENATIVFEGEQSGETRAALDLEPLNLEIPEDQRITLSAATLTVAAGVADLEFADHVRVSLNHAEAGMIFLADADVSGSSSLEIAGDPNVDLGTHLRDGATEIEISVLGDLPENRWTVLADLCFDLD